MRLIDADALESDTRRAILEFVKEDDFTTNENKQGTVRILQYFLEVIKEQQTIPVVGVVTAEGLEIKDVKDEATDAINNIRNSSMSRLRTGLPNKKEV